MDAAPERSQARRFFGLIIVTAATAQSLGMTLRCPSQLEANDISRWCTVWSLVERGTYAIDDCPWQARTQDKVRKPEPFAPRVEGQEPVKHFYSSKPPLLPTIIAGILYPIRQATGVPLDRVVEEPKAPRYVNKDVPGKPGVTERVLETPKDPVKWPVYVFYFKPIVLLFNLVPVLVTLLAYGRFLDRHAPNDWAWFLALTTAAFATPLFIFNQTLNNHSVAAWSAYFATAALIRVWDDDRPPLGAFIAAGFFGAFCACNELPAALFGILLFALLLYRHPRRTLLAFVPAAIVPCAAFLATQYLALGQLKPVYEEFGTEAYNYEGSYWNTPLEMDYLNLHPESKAVYLWHMTFGHHGVFSLTPLFVFSIYGAWRLLRRREGGTRGLAIVAGLTLGLTVLMLAFYDWNPKARNYGGSTQGLRWLFWLVPFWLLTLPEGLAPGQERRGFRVLTLAALAVAMLTVGYGMRTPWSHPWYLDMLEHLGLYHLVR